MIKVGILGATGFIGAHYISLLGNHPFFQLHALAGSEKSEGTSVEGFKLRAPSELLDCSLIFSALPNSFAQKYEPFYALQGIPIISSASCYRLEEDVPLLIPEINDAHLAILPFQKKNRQWKGYIISKPNCTIQSFLLPLALLHNHAAIEKISVTTMQAISGAGMQGLPSHSILDNIIPYIDQEEEKCELEPLKILGNVVENKIISASSIKIGAHCNRVSVLHGHTACVSVSFKHKLKKEEILEVWKKPSSLLLPTAPKQTIHYLEDLDRPQPRLDRDRDKGMAVTVGRLRPCPLFDWRFVALTHNTARGGAGGGLLTAELLKQGNYLG